MNFAPVFANLGKRREHMNLSGYPPEVNCILALASLRRTSMTRFLCLLATVLVVSTLVVPAALADEPLVSKRVVAAPEGSLITIRVTAGDTPIYGLSVTNENGSIEDVYAPQGWVAVATTERILFRTEDASIPSGGTMTFTVISSDSEAGFDVTFRGEKAFFGRKQSI